MKLDQFVCRLDGGFGNQLFQYATARSIADRLGCDLLLDARAVQTKDSRDYGLGRYAIRADLAAPDLLDALPSPRSSRAGRLRSRLALAVPSLFPSPVFWPASFAYDERVLCITRPMYLVGYWQSERYFGWNRSRLQADLHIKQPVLDPTGLKERIVASHSVALHIRRGDYHTNTAAAQTHGLCDHRYYVDAVSYMAKHHSDMQLFVFSDEPEWVRQNFQFNVPMVVVDASMGSSTSFDFEMMRTCKHHIISNSTYSWWAAWLAEHDRQIVIAPQRWFNDQTIASQDVVPQRWVRI